MLFVACLFALSACGARKLPGLPITVVPKAEPIPEENTELLGKRLRATVLELYSQLTLGNLDAYLDAFAKNTFIEIIVAEPRSKYFSKAEKPKNFDPRIFIDRQPQILAKNLTYQIIEGTNIAWVFDETSYRIVHQKRLASMPIRRSGVYQFLAGRWVILQEHWSYPASINMVTALFDRKNLPSDTVPEEVNDGPGTDVRKIKRQIRRLHSGRSKKPLSTADGSTLLVSLGLEAEFRSSPPRIARIFGPDATMEISGARVHVDSEKKAAWASAILKVSNVLGASDPTRTISIRASYVLVRNEQKNWSFVHMHLSVPMTEELLFEQVLGHSS